MELAPQRFSWSEPEARRSLDRAWTRAVPPCCWVLACCWGLVSCTGDRLPEGTVVLVESAPQSLDPRFVIDDIGTKISKLVFVGLLTFDTPDCAPELVLAESVEHVSETRIDVVLRAGLTFHDGGRLTADDVRFTFESTPPLMASLDRIEVHDERRLSFILREPYAPFVDALAVGIVSRAQVTQDLDDRAPSSEPDAAAAGVARVGAGPFAIEQVSADQFVALRRFEGYAAGPLPSIERLVFRVVRDDNARLIALLGGSADLAVNNVTPLMLPVVQDDRELRVTTSRSVKYTYLMFNTRVPPLDDVRVRRAFAYAIDRDEIITYKFRGLATAATGMLAPVHWAYTPEVRRYGRDLTEAKRLLDAAGLADPDGDGPAMRFVVSLRVSASKFRKAIAELLAAQLAEAGIGVRVETLEFGTFFAQVHAGNFQLASLQWPSPVEPDLLYVAFHSRMVPWENPDGRGRNRGGFASAELDQVLEAARRTADRARRKALYARAQQLLAEELPYVPLWHEDNIAVVRRTLEGFVTTPNARLRALERSADSRR